MNEEVINQVLTEMLEDISALKGQSDKNQQALMAIWKKLNQLEVDKGNTQLMEQIESIKIELVKYNAPVKQIKQYRILLFPDSNAREYYRIVYGRLFFWMAIFLGMTYCYALLKELIFKI